MQFDRSTTYPQCAFFHTHQQLPRYSHAPKRRQHLDGPDISSRSVFLTAQPNHGKPDADIIHNSQPRPAVWIVRQRPHQTSAKPHGRLKTSLLNRIQRTQIGSIEQPRNHLIYSLAHHLRPQKERVWSAKDRSFALHTHTSHSHWLLDLRFQIRDHIEKSLIQPSIRGDRFLDRDVRNVRAAQHGDTTPLLLVHHVDGV
jgi:hypothetical protein